MSSIAPVRPALGAGAARHSTTGRNLSHENRLSIIDENSDSTYQPPPRVPPRAINRPLERMFGYHRDRRGRAPPPYSEYDDVTGPKGEKFSDVRENRRFLAHKKRGGWKRLAIIAFIIGAVIAAIAVGVIVGLHKHNKKSNSTPSASKPPPFPAGAWTFTTFLATTTSACTSNPSTWLCFPYTTYNESSTSSMITFNWLITFTGLSDANYVISSSDNPFALTFTNASLQLIDSGLATEAYTFSVPMEKIVMPQVALTNDNAATSCIYNNTVLEARLYTEMLKTYPSNPADSSSTADLTTPAGNDAVFKQWPHAAKVDQVINGGADVPSCYKTVNGELGARVTEGLESQPGTKMCKCEYMNFGNGNS